MFLWLLVFECTFTSFFIDKKSKESQIVEIKVFFLFVDARIQIRKAQSHTDPDPQHCYEGAKAFLKGSLFVILVNFHVLDRHS